MTHRILTGDPGLDTVVGGGLDPSSLVVVAGAPGTGKTILAQQLAFANATDARKALYFTTWSEPHDKLVRHLRPFAFFDEAALWERVEFINVADLTESGVEAVGGEIVRRCFNDRPAVVVLDSSKALQEVAGEAAIRRTLYDLAGRVALTGALLVFVGEYTPAEIEQSPEFAFADVIVQLVNESHGPADRRWLRLLKLRGGKPLPGQHSFAITASGLEVYPRLETTVPTSAPEPGTERATFGVAGLDDRLGGGLPRQDATLVLGPSGVGKTVLALRFLASAAEAGERALYLSFQETAPQLRAKARSLGWELDPDAVSVVHVAPVEVDLDAVAWMLRRELAAGRYTRIVVDSLAELSFAAQESERFPAYIWALTGYIRAAGASALFTNETAALGPTANPAGGLSLLFNNVILLRYLERDSQIRRALGVLKMRNSDHDRGLAEFDVGAGGLTIGNELTDVTGLLGWSTLRSDEHA
jgi:circadian clock protein KaiC